MVYIRSWSQLVNKVLLKGKNRWPSALFMVRLSKLTCIRPAADPVMPSSGLDNVKPALEVRSRRVGGATYRVLVRPVDHAGAALARRLLAATP